MDPDFGQNKYDQIIPFNLSYFIEAQRLRKVTNPMDSELRQNQRLLPKCFSPGFVKKEFGCGYV